MNQLQLVAEPNTPESKSRLFWVVVTLISWLSIGGLHALTRVADTIKYDLPTAVSWAEVSYYLLAYASWAVLTLSTVYTLDKPVTEKRWVRIAAIFIIGLTIWLPIYFSYDFAVSVVTLNGEWQSYWLTMQGYSASVIFFYVVLYFLNFVVCLSIIFAANNRRTAMENQRLIQQRTENELALTGQKMQLLQSQLSPHFLFNCLSGISGLARNGGRDELISAVAQVGSLLRFTIGNAKQSQILLTEELALIEDYIALQTLRFPDRFTLEKKFNEIDANCLCPPFFIQPVLENIFTHAVEASNEHIEASIHIYTDNRKLCVDVENTSPNQSAEASSLGSALGNLRTRLNLLYGDRFKLETGLSDGQFLVKMSIPHTTELAKTHAI